MGGARGPSPARWALLAFLALVAAYLFVFAARLTLDYFDSYENLLNARALTLAEPDLVYSRRFYLPSVLYSPFFFVERWTDAAFLGFRAAHMAGVAFYLGALAFFYRSARLRLDKWAALVAAALLAVNPVLLQMAPFAKEDMPALFFLTGAAYFILQYAGRARRSTYFWMTAFAAAAVACRYNLLPIVFLLYFAAAAQGDGAARRKMLVSFLTASALFLAGGVLFFWRIEKGALPAASASFLASIWEQYAFKLGQKEPASENLWLIGRTLTWPLAAVFVLGLAACWKRSRKEAFFFATWIFPMLAVQSVFVGGKEARYLLPFFPAAYFLVGEGLSAIAARFRSRCRPVTAAALMALTVAALAVLPLGGAARSLLRYRDPVFFDPFEQRVSTRAAQVSQTGRILWCGVPYTLRPNDYLFDRSDEFTHIYHFYAHTVRFYAPLHEVSVWSHEVQDTRRLGIRGIPFMLLSTVAAASDGDALIVHSSDFYDSSTVPAERFPVWIARVRAYDFTLGDPNGSDSFDYRCEELKDALITLDRKAPGTRLIALRMPVAPMNFYTDVPGKGVKMFQPHGFRRDSDSAVNILAAMEDKLAPLTIRVVVYEVAAEIESERKVRP